VVNVANGDSERLTDNQHNDWDPAWSPDGRCIAVTSEVDGNRDIYVLNAETGEIVRQLTYDGAIDWLPDWSPAE
jgi:TolB protein